MKKITIILIGTLLTFTSYAQSEIRTVEDFSELNIKNAFEVVLTKGDKNEIKIITEKAENIQKVVSDVSAGKLNIYIKAKSKIKGSIKIEITYKNLTGINQSGATELSATNTIKADDFYLKGSGAIEVNLDFDVTNLSVNLSGASEVLLKGSVGDFELTLSGASELNASNLKSRSANINISGASEVDLNVSESIKGKASGATKIMVSGGASVDNIKTSGVASILKR